jgi:hypothetical protein
MLLLLAFVSSCATSTSAKARASLDPSQQAMPPRGALLHFRYMAPGPHDLWLQSLDGKTHRPLTSSGKVQVLLPRSDSSRHWGGAVISPDQHSVAYVEFRAGNTPGASLPPGPVGGWNTLFVVRADGTSRRELVDLTQQPLPRGRVVAGNLLWSDEGRSILYALEILATKDNGWSCSQMLLQSVDVESGRVTSLSEVGPLRNVTLLGWSESRGEIFLYGHRCPAPDEEVVFPRPEGRFIVLRPGEGTLRQQRVPGASLSPERTFVFLPAQPNQGAPAGIYRTDSFTLARVLPPELPAGDEARIIWWHHSPGVLVEVTQRELPFGECVGAYPQRRRLFRWETDTGSLSLVREDARALNIVAVSPDDADVLVGILTGDVSHSLPCNDMPFEALYRVRREELESELPVEELRRRAILLTPPRLWSSLHPFAEYVGWVR